MKRVILITAGLVVGALISVLIYLDLISMLAPDTDAVSNVAR
jgi:hypothetical protein